MFKSTVAEEEGSKVVRVIENTFTDLLMHITFANYFEKLVGVMF